MTVPTDGIGKPDAVDQDIMDELEREILEAKDAGSSSEDEVSDAETSKSSKQNEKKKSAFYNYLFLL